MAASVATWIDALPFSPHEVIAVPQIMFYAWSHLYIGFRENLELFKLNFILYITSKSTTRASGECLFCVETKVQFIRASHEDYPLFTLEIVKFGIITKVIMV